MVHSGIPEWLKIRGKKLKHTQSIYIDFKDIYIEFLRFCSCFVQKSKWNIHDLDPEKLLQNDCYLQLQNFSSKYATVAKLILIINTRQKYSTKYI